MDKCMGELGVGEVVGKDAGAPRDCGGTLSVTQGRDADTGYAGCRLLSR